MTDNLTLFSGNERDANLELRHNFDSNSDKISESFLTELYSTYNLDKITQELPGADNLILKHDIGTMTIPEKSSRKSLAEKIAFKHEQLESYVPRIVS